MPKRARPDPPTPPPWETLTLEAVGRVIEFWGFKRNQGRLWALLYLTNAPLNATELGRRLGLSKGAVSMVVRELESFEVVRRVPVASRSGVAYAAQRDLWRMIHTVHCRSHHFVTGSIWSLQAGMSLGVESLLCRGFLSDTTKMGLGD